MSVGTDLSGWVTAFPSATFPGATNYNALDASNNYMYVSYKNGTSYYIARITNLTSATPAITYAWYGPISVYTGKIIIDKTNTYMYVANYNGVIQLNTLTTPATPPNVSAAVYQGISNGQVTALCFDKTQQYLFVGGTTANYGIVRTQIGGTSSTNVAWIAQNVVSNLQISDMVIDSTNTYMFLISGGSIIYRVQGILEAVARNITPLASMQSTDNPQFFAIDTFDNIYMHTNNNSPIYQWKSPSTLDPSNNATQYSVILNGAGNGGVVIDATNTYLYSLTGGGGNSAYFIGRIALPAQYIISLSSSAVVCFKEGTKILTKHGYTLIEQLRPHDLIKTFKHGYVPLHLIGKRKIEHHVLNERIKQQLYVLTSKQYPTLFEDLILTGCHSILVDDFSNETQRKQTIEINGDTYITDNKYRLPACVDEKADVYDVKGTYYVYHVTLEHDDDYMNYGIYANGLLVESSCKCHVKEFMDVCQEI